MESTYITMRIKKITFTFLMGIFSLFGSCKKADVINKAISKINEESEFYLDVDHTVNHITYNEKSNVLIFDYEYLGMNTYGEEYEDVDQEWMRRHVIGCFMQSLELGAPDLYKAILETAATLVLIDSEETLPKIETGVDEWLECERFRKENLAEAEYVVECLKKSLPFVGEGFVETDIYIENGYVKFIREYESADFYNELQENAAMLMSVYQEYYSSDDAPEWTYIFKDACLGLSRIYVDKNGKNLNMEFALENSDY